MSDSKLFKDHFWNYFENLTLHQKIALYSSSMVFVMSLLLVLFINLVSSIIISREIGKPDRLVLVEILDAEGNEVTVLAVTPAPEGYTISRDTGIIRGDPLSIVRALSIFGLVLVIFTSYFAGQWIARKSLQPIRQISQIAHKINSRTLDQHLNYKGPHDEIKELADAFDLMLDRLENNFKQQSQFTSNLAHELRTPLTSLRMNVELLKSDPQATLDDYKELSDTYERSLTQLERLIEDLLFLARGEMQISHQLISLGVLLEEVLEELEPIAQEKNVALRMSGEIDLEIFGDPILLQRAFSNLVENGIRYNREGGFVEVTIRRENCQTLIAIRDNGIGISKYQQAHIFERFYRSQEAMSSNQLGKGLGLAITAHIVSLHQGRVEVESTLGTGSIFRVLLPIIQNSGGIRA